MNRHRYRFFPGVLTQNLKSNFKVYYRTILKSAIECNAILDYIIYFLGQPPVRIKIWRGVISFARELDVPRQGGWQAARPKAEIHPLLIFSYRHSPQEVHRQKAPIRCDHWSIFFTVKQNIYGRSVKKDPRRLLESGFFLDEFLQTTGSSRFFGKEYFLYEKPVLVVTGFLHDVTHKTQ